MRSKPVPSNWLLSQSGCLAVILVPTADAIPTTYVCQIVMPTISASAGTAHPAIVASGASHPG